MNLHIFTHLSARRPRVEASRRRRPILEDLESRTVMSTASMAAPHAVPAQVSAPSRLASQVHVSVPLTITGIDLTKVTRDATSGVLSAFGTLTGNLLGHSFTTDLAATITRAGGVPVLHLRLDPIHLDLLGLVVDTSPICLDITAKPGPGNLLGNLLGGLTRLLDAPGTASDPSSALPGLGNILNNRSLLRGLNTALGRATSQATNPTVTGPTTNILNLSIGPVGLDLLGLHVNLDDCNNGPVTVGINAVGGSGKLLGNLLSSIAHLLDSPGNPTGAITGKINNVLGIVRHA